MTALGNEYRFHKLNTMYRVIGKVTEESLYTHSRGDKCFWHPRWAAFVVFLNHKESTSDYIVSVIQ
jgi:hypothetical protein